MNLSTYQLLMRLLSPLLLLGFIVRSISHKAYRQRLDERLGYIKVHRTGGVLIHCASVGEVIAVRGFIQQLRQQHPNAPLTISTFTPTGSAQALREYGDEVQHVYLPLDTPGATKRFLDRLRPELLILMETELWPSLIHRCAATHVKLILINGRISERSFPKYLKIRPLIASTLRQFDRILVQSKQDKIRFDKLGANCSEVAGNLKYDLAPRDDIKQHASALRAQLGSRPIWVIGSSHDDEEDQLLTSMSQLVAKQPDILIIIAPRHPERVAPLLKKLNQRPFGVVLRSEKVLPTNHHHVWLIDTMGELLLFYALADVCTIAGSFGATEGHNPLEACLFAKPITMGPRVANFKEIAARLSEAGAMETVSADTLAEQVSTLLNAPNSANSMGARGQQVLIDNQGATRRTLEHISPWLATQASDIESR